MMNPGLNPQSAKTLQSVQIYYGKVLQNTKDLKTSACCSAESLPVHLRELVKQVILKSWTDFMDVEAPFLRPSKGGRFWTWDAAAVEMCVAESL